MKGCEMSDGFEQLIEQSLAFFANLKANNTKDFYAEHKDFYTTEIKKPAELLADILGDEISRLTKVSLTPKLFRIHRDVRFSKDKTPYNTHLHMMWRASGDTAPVWFFGASPDYIVTGMGVMGLQGDALTQYRTMIDDTGDDLQAALDAAQASVNATLSDWRPPPLKRVPKPYNPDHPHGDLLKRKALAINAPLGENWRTDGVIPSVKASVKGMMPVWKILHDQFG